MRDVKGFPHILGPKAPPDAFYSFQRKKKRDHITIISPLLIPGTLRMGIQSYYCFHHRNLELQKVLLDQTVGRIEALV